MSPRRPNPQARRARQASVLGVVTILAVCVAAYVSYHADDGLPWQHTYDLTVVTPNATRLIKNSEVRIGGRRVGRVADVGAIPGDVGRAPQARVRLALDAVESLPVDSRVGVRPSSVLGATFVEIDPGRSDRSVPDGGTLLPRPAPPTVDLTDLLDVFDASTGRSIRATLRGVGDGLAGRGPALGATIGSLSQLLPATEAVAAALADPRTRLSAMIHGWAGAVDALAPVRSELAALIRGGAQTFDALAQERRALADAIATAPDAEAATTHAFNRLGPALEGLARLADELKPAAPLLRPAVHEVDATFASGVRPMRALPGFSRRLRVAVTALRVLARDRATTNSMRKLTRLSRLTEEWVEPLTVAQLSCNTLSLYGQNLSSIFIGIGVNKGPAMGIVTLDAGATREALQNATPAPNIGIDPYPHLDERECEAGSEPDPTGQLLGNPPGLQRRGARETAPPPGVRERARAAGLLDTPEGAR